MPLRQTTVTSPRDFAGGTDGFVGPINHTVAVPVNLANLTNKEIDTNGYVKPYVPLTKGGALVGTPTRSTPGSATAAGGNVGDGTFSAITGGYSAPAETITVTITTAAANAGSFRVEGTKSGLIGTGTVAVAFSSPVINFTLNDGATDFAVDDSFTFSPSAGVSSNVFGVTVEHVKVADDNAAGTIAALGDEDIAVATICQVNKAYAEDVLDRSYTAAEVSGMAPGASGVVLL